MITLDKIKDCTTEYQGLILRGTPTRVGQHVVTFKVTKAWGLDSGVDYTDLVRGRKITVAKIDCDLYR